MRHKYNATVPKPTSSTKHCTSIAALLHLLAADPNLVANDAKKGVMDHTHCNPNAAICIKQGWDCVDESILRVTVSAVAHNQRPSVV